MNDQSNEAMDLGSVLEGFSPGMALYVPDEILGLWFPPGAIGGKMEPSAEIAATKLASLNSCSFEYHAGRNAGCFTKIARC